MTLILTSKYHASGAAGARLFISNRLLRIVPSFYVVLALSLAFYAAVVPGWLLLVVTVALSVPLVFWLEHPIDRWRQAWLAKQTAKIADPVPA